MHSAHRLAELEQPLRQAPQSDIMNEEGQSFGQSTWGRAGTSPPHPPHTHTLPTHPSREQKHVHDGPQDNRHQVMAYEVQKA